MPIRSRSHQLETRSRLAFEAALPDPWLYRRKDDDDYGIDGEVEVFEADGGSTGLHFHVQLKSTDGVGDQALTRSIRIDHAHYYRSLALPVLMVRYLAQEDTLYTRWFHSHDSYGSKPDAQSLTFRWLSSDQWTEARPEELAAEARSFLELRSVTLRLPVPFYLDVGANPLLGLTASEIEIALRAEAGKRPDVLQPLPGPPKPGVARLVVTPDQASVELARAPAATLHFDDAYDVGPRASRLAQDTLALTALAFENAGQVGVAGRLAVTYVPGSWVASNQEAAAALSASMARARQVREALDLAEVLDVAEDESSRETSVLFTLPALTHSALLGEEEDARFREVARNRIGRRLARGDSVDAGREYHNLANHHRTRGEPEEALRLFDLAIEHDPEYGRRMHYWQERAGVLFGTFQYADASDAYKRAIDLGASEWVRALHADALLFAGRYDESLAAFVEYNASHANVGRGLEWNLKEAVARHIVEGLGIRCQTRDSKRARELFGRLAADPDIEEEIAYTRLQEILEIDALSPSVWMSIGLLEVGHDQHGFKAFRAGSLLQEGDANAWAFAYMSGYWEGVSEDVRLQLLATGQRMTAGEMVPALLDLVSDQTASFPREDFLSVLNTALAELLPEVDDEVEIRHLGDDGEVEGLRFSGTGGGR